MKRQRINLERTPALPSRLDFDRLTQAVTIFALLELYSKGEADWQQSEPFGPITVNSVSSETPIAQAG